MARNAAMGLGGFTIIFLIDPSSALPTRYWTVICQELFNVHCFKLALTPILFVLSDLGFEEHYSV